MAEWISVKDKLPEVRRAVLVWTPLYRNIFEAYLTGDKKWRLFGSERKIPNGAEVTHWMPLPEAPGEV